MTAFGEVIWNVILGGGGGGEGVPNNMQNINLVEYTEIIFIK